MGQQVSIQFHVSLHSAFVLRVKQHSAQHSNLIDLIVSAEILSICSIFLLDLFNEIGVT